MDGARPAVMPGVERGQQVHHLGPAYLTDHDSVGTHPQCLPDQVAHRDLADAFDVGTASHQPDQMRVRRSQFGGVLDADDAFMSGHSAERGSKKGCLAAAGPTRDEEGQAGPDDGVHQLGGLRRDGTGTAEGVEILGGRAQDPQRQAGSCGGDRRQHRV
ncbi:hypothetical protein ATO49_25925 [Mycolicibacterium fortuitum subsp. fortuitum DSM 46621 = ATCC 6841 = JCM 6387]|nr:hypothetical protein ATO49_25925 [Mycolicibacterium fortuitum subsp. fortuitum DSM 46621 = ATCC 6841 = JCM 6387]